MDSEQSSPRVKHSPRAPISLEGERRKAMHLIYAIEKDVDIFREKWLIDDNNESIDEWVDFVNLAGNRRGANTVFNSMAEFEQQLQKTREEAEEHSYVGSRNRTIASLQQVCDRQKCFENLYEHSCQRINDSLNHYMAKYCLSYFVELEDLDVECVRQYENNINRWQAEIRACLNDAEQAIGKINAIKARPFIDYITSYGLILRYMDSALNAFSSACDPFRSWVTADEGYVKKISIELSYLISRRAYITDVLRKNSYKIYETKAKELRTNFNNKKVEEEVQGTLSKRKFCRKREFSFVDKIEMTENILNEKYYELNESLNKLQSRPLHSLVREPSDGIKERTTRLQRDVCQLENKLEKMRKGKRDLRETRYSLQKEFHKLKGVYEMSLKKAAKEEERYKDNIQHVKDITEELKTVERKIKALRQIVEIKTHPATVKKIYFEGYVPGQTLDFRDTLREAIDVAASGVGKDWERMYQHLPFNPPRDPFLRNQDLELMDMDFRSIHPPCEQMALRSLDKWKSLSNVTSVNALVRTLRTIKKTDVAKKIEKQVLTVVN